MAAPIPPITQLLQRIANGDLLARDLLVADVYDELRRLARSKLGGDARLGAGHSIQPTQLVHEAYLHLLDGQSPTFENRRHFFFAAGRAMHDLIVGNARARASQKRGGGRHRVDVQALTIAIEAKDDDVLAVDEVLAELERDDPRKHQILQLRFFAGLSMTEIAEALGTPLRSLEREWRFLRAWLARRLGAVDGAIRED